MSKHTPGEWIADRGFRDAFYGGEHTTVQDDFMTIYCGLENDAFDPDKSDWLEVRGPRQEANARLCAAAPKMLKALKEALAFFDGRAEADHNGIRFVANAEMRIAEELSAAIAEAESRS